MPTDKMMPLAEPPKQSAVMFGALRKALELFTSYGDDMDMLTDVLSGGLWTVADAVEIDRVVVLRILDTEGKSGLKELYRWDRFAGGTAANHRPLHFRLENPALARWVPTLRSDICINARQSEMEPAEVAFMEKYGVKSMVAVPVFIHGGFWGCIVFSNVSQERPFDEVTVSFLRSASRLCASLIVRVEKDQEMKETFDTYRWETEKSLVTLKNILNGMDAYICVNVPETCEILFLNDKFRTALNIEDDGIGQYCFKLIQGGLEQRCDFCPYHRLAKEEVVVWEQVFQGRIIQKTARLIDWPGGGKAHLEYGVDITDRIRQQEMLENIFDAMDTLIYVSDLETDEILFINRKMRTSFGLEEKSFDGLRCWQFLRTGQNKRCGWCPKERLQQNPGAPIIWEEDDAPRGSFYKIDRIINWPDGRQVHMQQNLDITEIRLARKTLLHREKMLDTLNRAAIIFMSRGETTFDTTMTAGIELIADMAGFDRMSIFRKFKKPEGMYSTQVYRWDKESRGTVGVLMTLADTAVAKIAPRWEEILSTGEYINGPVSTMPEAVALSEFGSVSVLAIPVFTDNRFWGVVLYENRREERYFTESEIDILRSASLMTVNVVTRNEEALIIREADERAKLMLDTIPLSCVLWNRDGNVIDCNEAAVKLFGFADKQDCITNFASSSPPYQPDGRRSDEMIYQYINEAFLEGQCICEWMHKAEDEMLPSEVTLVRVKRGEDYVVLSYTRDMREYKQMMREIEVRNKLLQAVNHMSAILLRTNSDAFESDLLYSMGIMAEATRADRVYIWKNVRRGDKIYCSQIYEWVEGSEPQQGILPEEMSYELEMPGLAEILLHGECFNGIVRDLAEAIKAILTPQGILSILLVPIFLEGQFWGFLGFDDCHEERLFSRHEESILRSASELIADAMFRNMMEENLRVATGRLREALLEAQAANRAKSEFLSRMSHEMRTPMNAIIGMTTIGQQAEELERKNYAFNRIGEASAHLLGIINDILDISKIEANKLELVAESFSFGEMLKKALSFVRLRMEEKRQQFFLEIGGGVPEYVVGDEQRMKQVIINLLSNAVKFTPEDGEIRMRAILVQEQEKEEMCELRIEVADNGIGISDQQQTKIFLAFEQAEGGITRKFGGTGLGLSISKRIIERMGGKIWVESQEGSGARFIFTVKLKRAEAAVPPVTTERRPAADMTAAMAGKRLLVAEDMEINREILLALLDGMELVIDTAENGRKAVDMIAAAPGAYDLVFMDVQMPEMDGLEATRYIRTLPPEQGGNVPIIAMTANVYREDIENCLAAGMNDHVGKPLDMGMVMEKLRQYL